MPDADNDLWPSSFDVSPARSPVAVLQEQAGLLEPRTAGIVTADVEDNPTHVLVRDGCKTRSPIAKKLVLRGADLPLGYSYVLLRLFCPIDFYPAVIKDRPDTDDVTEIADEEAMLDVLRQIFTCSETQNVIGSIMKLVQEQEW